MMEKMEQDKHELNERIDQKYRDPEKTIKDEVNGVKKERVIGCTSGIRDLREQAQEQLLGLLLQPEEAFQL